MLQISSEIIFPGFKFSGQADGCRVQPFFRTERGLGLIFPACADLFWHGRGTKRGGTTSGKKDSAALLRKSGSLTDFFFYNGRTKKKKEKTLFYFLFHEHNFICEYKCDFLFEGERKMTKKI